MAAADEDRPRFTEQEMTMILRQAARVSVDEADSPRRYSLGDIERVAVQAGIDVQAVRHAAARLGMNGSRFALWGAASRVRELRSARRQVSDDELPHLVNVIESAAGMGGEAERIAGGLTWRARDSGGLLTVTVTRGAGVTEIVATAEREREARLAIAASFAGSAMLTYLACAALSAVMPTGGALAAMLVVFPLVLVSGARWMRGRIARRWAAACGRLADELLRRISETDEGK